MSLDRKQEYYRYTDGYSYKQPPVIDPTVLREMQSFGRDQYGDPFWRFVWGGVVVVKSSPDDQGGFVRGERAGAVVRNGELTCRYLHVKAKTLVGHCFRNRKGKGKVITVRRLEHIQKGALSWEKWEYAHYGKLRWFLERKLSAEQLVASSLWRGTEAEMPSEGDYVPIMNPPALETPDGLYFEPNMQYLDFIREHLQEEESEFLVDILAKYRKQREKREQDAQWKEVEQELTGILNELERPASRNPIHFAVTDRRRRPPVETGDIVSF